MPKKQNIGSYMKKLVIIASIVCIFTLIMVVCLKTPQKKAENEYIVSIVNPHFPTYDFTRAICKNIPTIKNELLIKPGSEVHSFDPSPANIRSLEKADLCFIIGGESDFWVKNILSSLDAASLKVISLFEEFHLEAHTHHHDSSESHTDFEIDEHLWTSLSYAQEIVKLLSVEIQNTYSNNAKKLGISQDILQETLVTLKQNTAIYIGQIQELALLFEQIIKTSEKPLIVMGDRFPFTHFAKEFGLEYQAAFEGCSSAVETTPARIATLITTVKENKLPSVFHIEMSNKKIASIIAESCNVPILELHSLQNVTKAEFDNGETYISLMKKNATNLKKGLRYAQ
ncbi:MAG: zinc ABC transporter substrate-binding protein [Spirochaetaceae bacterium]|nr:zinc ABC transporter substrate-binding protein [Spirochaetaceae bacterium]